MRWRALRVVFAVQIIALACLTLVAVDLYAHKRVDALAGMNIWGYRGAIAHQKQPREIRVVVIGGTRAFGLGMPASWTVATVMRQQVMLAIDRPGRELRDMVSLTLARPGALPDSYPGTLQHFAYLAPDFICIYDDLGVGGAALPEERSGMFARTGYWPALPIVLQEKGMAWRFGRVSAGYVRDNSGANAPGWAHRTAGAALEFAGDTFSAIDRSAARPASPHRADNPDEYATEVMHAVDLALTMSRGVVVAIGPEEVPRQIANAARLLPRLQARSAANARLRVVDLDDEPLLRDKSQRLDDWNFGGDAIGAAAKKIAPAMLELIALDDTARAKRP